MPRPPPSSYSGLPSCDGPDGVRTTLNRNISAPTNSFVCCDEGRGGARAAPATLAVLVLAGLAVKKGLEGWGDYDID